jgi:hypothetical protein
MVPEQYQGGRPFPPRFRWVCPQVRRKEIQPHDAGRDRRRKRHPGTRISGPPPDGGPTGICARSVGGVAGPRNYISSILFSRWSAVDWPEWHPSQTAGQKSDRVLPLESPSFRPFSACHPSTAAVDPFRPGGIYHITRLPVWRAAPASRGSSMASIPKASVSVPRFSGRHSGRRGRDAGSFQPTWPATRKSSSSVAAGLCQPPGGESLCSTSLGPQAPFSYSWRGVGAFNAESTIRHASST